MFRSEKMGFYNLVMQRESAWHLLNELGSMSNLHFIDMYFLKKKIYIYIFFHFLLRNPESANLNRSFTSMIKRCEESLLKLNSIEQEMK